MTECHHDLPCDCGSAASVYQHALADRLRHEHMRRHGALVVVAFADLTDSERRRWLDEARQAAGL